MVHGSYIAALYQRAILYQMSCFLAPNRLKLFSLISADSLPPRIHYDSCYYNHTHTHVQLEIQCFVSLLNSAKHLVVIQGECPTSSISTSILNEGLMDQHLTFLIILPQVTKIYATTSLWTCHRFNTHLLHHALLAAPHTCPATPAFPIL